METNPAQQLIEKEITLPSPPAIAVQILNTVKKEDAALKKLAEIISADPALTGKMLQIANSGFYAFKNEVTSIERALSVLGTNVNEQPRRKQRGINSLQPLRNRAASCGELDPL
jgi:HD-like signal output (HDOD) protein